MNCDSSSVFVVTTSATNNLIMILEETLAASESWECLGRLRAAGIPVDEVKLPEDLLQGEQL